MKIELTNITENAELHCEQCARDCYNSGDKLKDTASNLIKNCTINDHLTTIGHAMATFRIEGISRACSHQIVRHRHAIFSQRSQRYVKENFEFVIPDSIYNNESALFEYGMIMKEIEDSYNKLIKMGIKKEDARFVLPNACTTTLNMSMTFEGWVHFLRRRMDKHAQWEIRKVAFEIYKILNLKCPKIFNKETIMSERKLNIEWD